MLSNKLWYFNDHFEFKFERICGVLAVICKFDYINGIVTNFIVVFLILLYTVLHFSAKFTD